MTTQSPSFLQSVKKWLKNNALELCILLILVFAAYVNSLPNDFVSDDKAGIVSNSMIRSLPQIFSHPAVSLRYFMYYVTLNIFGVNPVPFRAVNILFHLGATLMLYLVVYLLSNKKIALFSAGVFAVHTMLVESVTWISAGSYPEYSFILLAATASYILSKRYAKLYYVSLALAGFAMMFSEKAIIFPGIIIALELSFYSIKKNWLRVLPFFAVVLLMGASYLLNIGPRLTVFHSDYYQPTNTWYNPLTQIPTAISSYVQMILVPLGYTLYHTETTYSVIEFVIRFIFTLFFFAAWIFSYFKNKFIFFWLSVFIIALIPTMTPVPIAWIVAERYAYLSTAGLIVVLSYLIYNLLTLKKLKLPPVSTWIVFGILVLALLVRTVFRNIDWTDEDHLWLAADKYSPHSYNNHNNLGDYYDRHGNYDMAIKEFKTAIALKADYADAYHNLANTYKEMGDFDNAMKYYEDALKINPTIWQSWHSIAEIFFTAKKYDLALKYMIKANEVSPNNPQIISNTGVIYKQLGDKEKAKEYFLRAIQIDPTYQPAQAALNSLTQGS